MCCTLLTQQMPFCSADASNMSYLSHWQYCIRNLALDAGDINEWQQCIQLNLLGPMALTHAFSPGMIERKVSCLNHMHVQIFDSTGCLHCPQHAPAAHVLSNVLAIAFCNAGNNHLVSLHISTGMHNMPLTHAKMSFLY